MPMPINTEKHNSDTNMFDMKNIDFGKVSRILGLQHTGESFIFDFFNQTIQYSHNEFSDTTGKPLTDTVQNVFYQYLLTCPDSICKNSDKLVTLREFPDSGPLFSRFTANTNKIIETTFSGKLDDLKDQCCSLNGAIMENASYDLSVKFTALSKIPIILNFNDKDEMMPANAVFLFDGNANSYLDLKSLGALLTYLTGYLIQ
jgi:Domain of unknown function (DUF3786)